MWDDSDRAVRVLQNGVWDPAQRTAYVVGGPARAHDDEIRVRHRGSLDTLGLRSRRRGRPQQAVGRGLPADLCGDGQAGRPVGGCGGGQDQTTVARTHRMPEADGGRTARCPVVVVRGTEQPPSGVVVMGVRDEEDLEAVRFAGETARRRKASLRLLSTWTYLQYVGRMAPMADVVRGRGGGGSGEYPHARLRPGRRGILAARCSSLRC